MNHSLASDGSLPPGASSSSLLNPLLLSLTVILLTLAATYQLSLPRPLPGIPHNHESARRPAGDVPHFLRLAAEGRRPRDFWADLCAAKNSAVAQYFPGPFARPVVVLSDFREAQDLFVRRGETVDRGVFGKRMWSGVGDKHFVALDSKDPDFHASKLLGRDLMTPNYIQTVSAPIAYENVNNLIELWKLKIKTSGGKPFKSINDLTALTADTIFETAMGITGNDKAIAQYRQQLFSSPTSTANTDRPDAEFHFPEYQPHGLLRTIEVLASVAGTFPTALFQSLHWPLHNLRPVVRRARADRFAIIQRYIDRALERWETDGPPQKPRWALDLIIKRERAAAQKAGRAADYASRLFHDAVYGYCLGGQDTTHSALSFLVMHFGRHPAAQDKLRRHLRAAHPAAAAEGGRPPTSDEICKTSVPYLDAFVEEVLRLNTTASAVIKETMQDINLLGHRVPRGHQILVPLWGACIDSPAFPVREADRSSTSREHAATTPADWSSSPYPAGEFHPERWLRRGDDDEGRVVFDPRAGPQMTFSLGPRECWGKRLAYLTLRLVTTLLVWNFDFHPLPEGMDSAEVVDVLNAKPKVSLIRPSVRAE